MLPHLNDLVPVEVLGDEGELVIEAGAAAVSARCPGCATASMRVHSRYRGRLADMAVADRASVLRLVVRRFFCDFSGCAARTFAKHSRVCGVGQG
ncbi:transposase family protein [Nocardia sp.]|uniref:transposase family protein n=1 Tax=Nocardia sp. TaxID=1821 RepID=UPI0034558476